MDGRLTLVIITPHTLRKSRTGAVISRLLAGTTGQLVGAQIVGLDEQMTEKLARSIHRSATPDEEKEKYRRILRDYIRRNFAPASDGRRHRALMLVFCGDGVQDEIEAVTGHLIRQDSGETIRNAFGDEVRSADGSLRYFEPAVLYSQPGELGLEIWEDFLKTYPNLVEGAVTYDHPERVQRTLVLIKPDSFRHRSRRPGVVVDIFSRTGLRIIGCKLVHMTVAQALQFYGSVRQVLARKLAPPIGQRAKAILQDELGFELPEGTEDALADSVGVPYAHEQFERLIEFMTGRRPSATPANEMDEPGLVGCLAIVYEGEDAVAKIRAVLGPTDPTQAPAGTVRKEFGMDVMVNTAHASDSPENAEREMRILKINESNLLNEARKRLRECRSRPVGQHLVDAGLEGRG